MKIVVLGGTGLIGSLMITQLTAEGHDAVAASPSSGVDTTTGAGLPEVLTGADVVVDVINSRSFEGVVEFFEASTGNAAATAREAQVGHYVLLSIVGTDQVPDAEYLVAKARQEVIVRDSGVPYTIVRATQFFEFIITLADTQTVDGNVYASSVLVQPIAAADVASNLSTAAVEAPVNGIVEIAGPQQFPLYDIIRTSLAASGDSRPVTTVDGYNYFGAPVERDTLVPTSSARLATTTYADWAK